MNVKNINFRREEVQNKSKVQVDLMNYYNFQYIGEVRVGSSKKQMEVLFDTGSAVTWLTGPLLDERDRSFMMNQ